MIVDAHSDLLLEAARRLAAMAAGTPALLAAVLLLAGCGGGERAVTERPPDLPPPPAAPDRRLGATPADGTIRFALLLRVDQRGIDRYLAGVNDPSSPRYHDFLSATEYGERFGLPRAELGRLRRLLERSDLRVGEPNTQRTTLPVEGSAAATGALLKTSFVDYRSGRGTSFHVPTRPPTIPAAMRDAVVGVSGLSTRPVVAPAGQGSDA